MASLLVEAFERYRSFAPEGWEPPAREDHAIRERFIAERAWALLAEAPGERDLAGIVSFLPRAVDRSSGDPLRGTAHFWHLFVRPPWWGTGLAAQLHAAALDEMRSRGIARARLFTPAGQLRARAFYVREGWQEPDAPYFESRLGMNVVELFREL
jgi:GNAT superfamily N-acetyltransferase